MANNTIFVSPGVYTKEIDLTQASAAIGVTTLGLVGETLKGPAFEPILIKNKTEFLSRFGLQSVEKFSNGVPKYELPYIANSYLEESNQLYVTRILGLSGYDAGKAWVIKSIGGLDPDTIGVVSSTGTTSFTGNTSTFSNSTINDLADDFDNLPITALNSGTTFTVSSGSTLTYNGTSFSATEVDLVVSTFSASTIGTATFTLRTITGSSLVEYNNIVVGMLRPRADYVDNELIFKTTGVTINTGATQDALGSFILTTDNNTYTVSLDESKSNFITKVLGITSKDTDSDIFVEDIYSKKLKTLVESDKVYGITSSLTVLNDLDDYKAQYATPETPYIVSQLKGNKIYKLFKFILISDGNDANKEVKISIENINFDTKEFDVVVRDFNDTDAYQVKLESFRRCSLNPQLTSYIGKRIGTTNGDYDSKSKYITVDLDDNAPIDAVPAGFEGYKVKGYTGVVAPEMNYKISYNSITDKVAKAYLGFSDIVGFDQNMFNYLGENISTGVTKGFHMDVNADSDVYTTGIAAFASESDVIGTDYEKLVARKFTVCVAGGFDGWDIYRNNRTNGDNYKIGQAQFSAFTQSLPSDYYAYLKGIRTFANPNEIDVNLFATPGIDYERQNSLVKETIIMIEEERADSLYLVTTPDQISSETAAEDMVDLLNAADIDSNYTTTFAPWIQHYDTQNSVNIWLPPTFDVLRNFAETDNKQAPWFATAGFKRGQLASKKARIKVNQTDSDTLYDGRINPIRTFSQSPLLIMGNKNLQQADTSLNRTNIRRLLLQVRKLVSAASIRLVFEPNDDELQSEFKNLINPILADVKKQRGVIAFEVICDESNNSASDRDQLQLNGYIRIKPTLALEYISLSFALTDQGATFDNI